jgi:hypothetical protein
MASKKAMEAARRLIEAAEEDEQHGAWSGWWNRHEDAIAEALDQFAAEQLSSTEQVEERRGR